MFPHFSPCCVSLCLLKSTLRWNPLPQRVTSKRFESGVFSTVCYQIGTLTEAFPHTWHLCGFSPGRENPYVSVSIQNYISIDKVLSVYLAYLVDECVFLHIWFLVESLSAVLARIGPCIGVYEEVSGQSGWSFKNFPTDFTIKASLLWNERRVLKIRFLHSIDFI